MKILTYNHGKYIVSEGQDDQVDEVFLGQTGWSLYLKFGAEAHSRARQARSTAAYTKRKKMVTMLAMVLSFPENSTSWKNKQE